MGNKFCGVALISVSRLKQLIPKLIFKEINLNQIPCRKRKPFSFLVGL